MAAGAIASLSRGAALVALGQIGLATITLVLATPAGQRRSLIGLIACFLGAAALAGYFEWENLWSRFHHSLPEQFTGRAEIHEHALQMARDFALLGSGPKTFAQLYEFYFSS